MTPPGLLDILDRQAELPQDRMEKTLADLLLAILDGREVVTIKESPMATFARSRFETSLDTVSPPSPLDPLDALGSGYPSILAQMCTSGSCSRSSTTGRAADPRDLGVIAGTARGCPGR
jgi:hypothetical protein